MPDSTYEQLIHDVEQIITRDLGLTAIFVNGPTLIVVADF